MHRFNSRGFEETYYPEKHVSLEYLRWDKYLNNRYLQNYVPLFGPVEFHVAKVCHVTGKRGLDGILDDNGFQAGTEDEVPHFLWWSLAITKSEIHQAEKRFLQTCFPNQTKDKIYNQRPFLECFTTSPAFNSSSRYGNYKFTFTLQELLRQYADQFCDGCDPVLSVYKTVVYRREIVYVVLVHSPDTFKELPPLQEHPGGVCAFQAGSMIWRTKTMSDIYRWKLVKDPYTRIARAEMNSRDEFYVWDHVTLAFDIPPGQTLKIKRDELIKGLSACNTIFPNLCRDPEENNFENAKKVVSDLQRTLLDTGL